MKPILDLFRKDQGGSTLIDMCPEFFAEALKKDEPKKEGIDNQISIPSFYDYI